MSISGMIVFKDYTVNSRALRDRRLECTYLALGLGDADTLAMEPVQTDITANHEPK